jgi:hypothetical protein
LNVIAINFAASAPVLRAPPPAIVTHEQMPLSLNLRHDLARLPDAQLAERLEESWHDFSQLELDAGFKLFASFRGPIRHPSAYAFLSWVGFYGRSFMTFGPALYFGLLGSLTRSNPAVLRNASGALRNQRHHRRDEASIGEALALAAVLGGTFSATCCLNFSASRSRSIRKFRKMAMTSVTIEPPLVVG